MADPRVQDIHDSTRRIHDTPQNKPPWIDQRSRINWSPVDDKKLPKLEMLRVRIHMDGQQTKNFVAGRNVTASRDSSWS